MTIARRRLFLVLLSALGALLVGCARSPRYYTQVKPGVDLSKYRTFAVMPIAEDVTGVDPGVAARAKPIVVNAIRTTLLAKGYQEAKVDEAEFTVAVNAAVLPRAQLAELGYAATQDGNAWYSQHRDFVAAVDASPDEADEAVIAVRAFDRRTKELIWFSWSSSIRRQDDSNSARIARARDLTLRLMSEFPIVPASS